MTFGEKMGQSLVASDWYILLAAVLTLLCMTASLVVKHIADRFIRDELVKKQLDMAVLLYNLLTVFYTLFITMISLFPLLGMFGTVRALLSLDLSDSAALESAKNSFFDALTSTAWGIIFAVGFKLVNAFFATAVEGTIQTLDSVAKKRRKKQAKTAGSDAVIKAENVAQELSAYISQDDG